MNLKGKKIFVMLGSSGSGKDTIAKSVFPSIGIPELISDTTRKPREGEVHGVNYYFRPSTEAFFAVPKIEWAEYPKDSGRYYGLSVEEVENKLSKYDTVYAVLEIQGAKFLKERYPDETIIIFCYVQLEEQIRRMLQRGDSEEAILERINNVKVNSEDKNYIYADFIIENTDLSRSIERLNNIVHHINNKEGKNIEIERKFLIKELPDLTELPREEVTQGYISFDPEIRVRKANNKYTKTTKSKGGLIRKEHTMEITEEEYLSLLKKIKGSIINKKRYFMLQGNHKIEIDVYGGNLSKLAVAEVEFMSEKEANSFIAPSWIGKEITDIECYKNSNLAKICFDV